MGKKKMGLLVEEGTENLLSQTLVYVISSGGTVVTLDDGWLFRGEETYYVTFPENSGHVQFYPLVYAKDVPTCATVFCYNPNSIEIQVNYGLGGPFYNSTIIPPGEVRILCDVTTWDRDVSTQLRMRESSWLPFYFAGWQLEELPYPTTFTDSTRAPSLTRRPLPTPLPSDFGIGLSVRMLHESAVKDRTFWQAGPYALRYDTAEEKIKMQFGEVEAAVDAEWQADDIIGVYGGKRDGKLFLQTKIAGEVSEEVEGGAGIYGDNLMLNSDFRDGLSGWGVPASTLSGVDNNDGSVFVQRDAASWTNLFIRQYFAGYKVGHKYYMKSKFKANEFVSNVYLSFTNTAANAFGKRPTANVWDTLSGILQYTTIEQENNRNYGCFLFLGSDADTQVNVKSVMVVDLTETFGAGNEPDKEWCDANLAWTPAPEDYEPITEITVGSNADGETGHLNGVLADFAYHFTPEKINPAGYLAKVPGGGK